MNHFQPEDTAASVTTTCFSFSACVDLQPHALHTQSLWLNPRSDEKATFLTGQEKKKHMTHNKGPSGSSAERGAN